MGRFCSKFSISETLRCLLFFYDTLDVQIVGMAVILVVLLIPFVLFVLPQENYFNLSSLELEN